MVTLKVVVQAYWIKFFSSNYEWSTFYCINHPLLLCFLCRCQTRPECQKIKSVFITFKLIQFFPLISNFDEVLIVFQKKSKKIRMNRMTSEKHDDEWRMKKKWLSGLFYISFDWVLTSPNLHWKQQKYPFLMVLATHSRLKSFWCSFFPFIFISLTCHTTHCDLFIFFFERLLKILKHCQLIWKKKMWTFCWCK
jgi:hypothetical protein